MTNVAARFNAEFDWPADAAIWLDIHEGIYGPVLVAAIILACLAAAPSCSSGSWFSLSTLLLLVTVQMRRLSSVFVFVAVTLFVMSIGIVLDRRAERAADDRWISIPSLSFQRWVTGPGAVVGLPLLVPLLVFVGMVEAFRVEQAPMPSATGAASNRSAPAVWPDCARRDGCGPARSADETSG